MMVIYKKHKVNPVGGCLPMLIQLPVFFALYKTLLVAIELRQAPFILWITDLSVKDPFYVFPIAMGLTMVLQQKMTPSAMDPKQAKMMMLMPIVFTFMFLSFPAGLVIYWLVNNVLGIIQQFFVNRQPS
jgi:YidC/Oxa1 family membrane protein insertase